MADAKQEHGGVGEEELHLIPVQSTAQLGSGWELVRATRQQFNNLQGLSSITSAAISWIFIISTQHANSIQAL